MLMMTSDGPQWHCAGCRQPIVTAEALALYRPLAGTADATAMMLVHKTCTTSEEVLVLMPRYHSRPLRKVMADLQEILGD
jgi:hypothetical protein